MALIPFAILWLGYQLGWYGYTTIAPYCNIGFVDLLLPGKIDKVDRIIQAGKGANCPDCNKPLGPFGTPPPASGVQNCPPGMVWVGSAATGGCVQGATV